jgi:hypothetical protein
MDVHFFSLQEETKNNPMNGNAGKLLGFMHMAVCWEKEEMRARPFTYQLCTKQKNDPLIS